MEEIWKDIPNFDGMYQISNLGRVKSLCNDKEKILKTRLHPTGYELINLREKTYRVHYLVAVVFLENPNNYTEINHINEIKNDNRAENLEWCTRKYNCNYGSLPKQVGKRFSKKVVIIDDEGRERCYFESSMSAERILKIDHSSIIKCCKGKVKTAGGYKWKYVSEVTNNELPNNWK